MGLVFLAVGVVVVVVEAAAAEIVDYIADNLLIYKIC
jgi:hypothetical protein